MSVFNDLFNGLIAAPTSATQTDTDALRRYVFDKVSKATDAEVLALYALSHPQRMSLPNDVREAVEALQLRALGWHNRRHGAMVRRLWQNIENRG